MIICKKLQPPVDIPVTLDLLVELPVEKEEEGVALPVEEEVEGVEVSVEEEVESW